LPRCIDRDARGNSSEEALTQFTTFFLTTCVDQVTFMENLMQPDQLRTRILPWGRKKLGVALKQQGYGRPSRTHNERPPRIDRSGPSGTQGQFRGSR
jgi:hypothetical protein